MFKFKNYNLITFTLQKRNKYEKNLNKIPFSS